MNDVPTNRELSDASRRFLLKLINGEIEANPMDRLEAVNRFIVFMSAPLEW